MMSRARALLGFLALVAAGCSTYGPQPYYQPPPQPYYPQPPQQPYYQPPASATGNAPAQPVDDGPPPDSDPPLATYQTRTIAGLTVHVAARALAHGAETEDAIALLGQKLAESVADLGPEHLRRLGNLSVWVEWDRLSDRASQYHRSAQWLGSHGYLVEKENGIEISNVRNFVRWVRQDQPMLVLHEFAHAYQHDALGDDSSDVKAAYDAAVASGRYESVSRQVGGSLRTERAYALADPTEYFAELSEAYFGRNDYQPFDRAELARFDPTGYALVDGIWRGNARR
jgi:hypothetical protein